MYTKPYLYCTQILLLIHKLSIFHPVTKQQPFYLKKSGSTLNMQIQKRKKSQGNKQN